MKAALEAQALSKRYEQTAPLALDSLNLSIAPGELYGLLGANGAGKTTTINLFLGFLRPTAGKALIQGVDVHADPLEAKKHIAYVPENVNLYGAFGARRNLQYFARLAGRPEVGKDECKDILARVGLPESSFDQPVRSFSKGMRQKLGIAVAMVKNASVLLLDEPTSGLDPSAGLEFIELLQSFKQEGKAILMSTHDIFRLKGVASRVGIMRQGKLLVEKTQQELALDDLQELYLAYMNPEGSRN